MHYLLTLLVSTVIGGAIGAAVVRVPPARRVILCLMLPSVRRAAARRQADLCTRCGEPCRGEPFWVEGALVCRTCVRRSRRGILVALGAFAAVALLFAVLGGASAVLAWRRGDEGWSTALAIAGGAPLCIVGSVCLALRLMKLQNRWGRKALVAEGELEALGALATNHRAGIEPPAT